jgi:hypothetical protein
MSLCLTEKALKWLIGKEEKSLETRGAEQGETRGREPV